MSDNKNILIKNEEMIRFIEKTPSSSHLFNQTIFCLQENDFGRIDELAPGLPAKGFYYEEDKYIISWNLGNSDFYSVLSVNHGFSYELESPANGSLVGTGISKLYDEKNGDNVNSALKVKYIGVNPCDSELLSIPGRGISLLTFVALSAFLRANSNKSSCLMIIAGRDNVSGILTDFVEKTRTDIKSVSSYLFSRANIVLLKNKFDLILGKGPFACTGSANDCVIVKSIEALSGVKLQSISDDADECVSFGIPTQGSREFKFLVSDRDIDSLQSICDAVYRYVPSDL